MNRPCETPGCPYERSVGPQSRYCSPCAFRRDMERLAGLNKQRAERVAERRATRGKPCETVGCTGRATGKRVVCPHCTEQVRLARKRERQRALVAARGGEARPGRRIDDADRFSGIRPEMRTRVEKLAERAAMGLSLFPQSEAS